MEPEDGGSIEADEEDVGDGVLVVTLDLLEATIFSMSYEL